MNKEDLINFNLCDNKRFIEDTKEWIYFNLKSYRYDIEDVNELLLLTDKYFNVIEKLYGYYNGLICQIEQHLSSIGRSDIFQIFVLKLNEDHRLYNVLYVDTCKKLIEEVYNRKSDVFDDIPTQFENIYNHALENSAKEDMKELYNIYKKTSNRKEEKKILNTMNNLNIEWYYLDSVDEYRKKESEKLLGYIKTDIETSVPEKKEIIPNDFAGMLCDQYQSKSELLLKILEECTPTIINEEKQWIKDKGTARLFFDILKEQAMLKEDFNTLKRFKEVFINVFPDLKIDGFRQINNEGRIYKNYYNFIKEEVVSLKNRQ